MIIVLSLWIVSDVRGMPLVREPQKKRGALAWENAKKESGNPWDLDVFRLLVHSVDDATGLKVYAPEVRLFLQLLVKNGIRRLSLDDLDRHLAQRLGALCYRENAGSHRGANLVFGVLWAFPEMKGHLPRSIRSIVSWRKMLPGGEGAPLPEEAVMFAIKKALEAGSLEYAVVIGISYDCYLRSQDWSDLRCSDICSDGRSVALLFGVQQRGEKSKNGTNQGEVL